MDLNWQHTYTTIKDANLYLLKSKKFSDVTFVVGDQKEIFEAHKLILMTRSPVFEAMFERWETGQNCKIEVPEISGKSFQMFLKFLYGNEFVVTGNEAAEVLYLAHKYDTKELASKCSDMLKSATDIKNVIHIHQVATKLEQEALRTQAMEFILKNGKRVVEDIGFLQMDLDTMRSILENDKLVADELTIFRAVMKWAEFKCVKQKKLCTMENKRDILQNIIPLIRFPTMSSQEFTDEIIGKYPGILTDSETIGIYMHLNTGSTVQSGAPKLPFNKTKRLPATIYAVIPYVNAGFTEASCQYSGHGAGVTCHTTIHFDTNLNIHVTAIELFEQSAGSSQFSISVYPSYQPRAITLARLRPNSSTIFDLNNGGIDVHKGVPWIVEIKSNGGHVTIGGNRQVMNVAGAMKVNSGMESIIFLFSVSSEDCPYRHRRRYCICFGQIKAIHFTI